MMKPVILFRDSPENRDELAAAWRHCDVVSSRSKCRNNLVFGRYSVLPFYQELTYDLEWNNSSLVNSFDQHRYIANFDYYWDIHDLTFPSWHDLSRVPDECFPIVVKGRTNSRKHRFATQMFAKDRRTAAEISHELKDDVLIGPQGLVYRQFFPLKVLEQGINGCAFTNEWRTFVLRGEILATGYYWSQLDDMSKPCFTSKMNELIHEVVERVSPHVPFFVIDVAERENGEAIVVELNDAQMSGLSMVDPDEFYQKLAARWDNSIFSIGFNSGL